MAGASLHQGRKKNVTALMIAASAGCESYVRNLVWLGYIFMHMYAYLFFIYACVYAYMAPVYIYVYVYIHMCICYVCEYI